MPVKRKTKPKATKKTQNKAAIEKRPAPKLPKMRHTVRDHAQALQEAQGYVSIAAQILGITPSGVQKAIQRHSSLRALHQRLAVDRRLPALDMGEAKLMEAVREGKSWAVKYLLDNHGAERGYGRRLALNGRLDAELTPGDPLAVYRNMDPEERKRRIAELLQRTKALSGE
jgi:hypothetical protein